MHSGQYLLFFALVFASDVPHGKATAAKDLADDPFLRPYVEQLKKGTPADSLARITAMAQSELILLHR